MLTDKQEHALASHLRACGHFLYYQTGGKAGQRRILVTLLKREELTQKQMQNALEISSGALSEILQKMHESVLIERKRGHDDKRQIKLSLTPKGKEKALQETERYSHMLEKMFECLSPQEKDQLDTILVKLTDHLDALKNEPLLEQDADDLPMPII